MKIKKPTMHCSLGLVIGAGALLLLASGARAQNMFVGSYGGNSVVEIPTSGPQSNFATDLQYPNALAFSGANLYVADQSAGKIYEYGPGGGTPTLFAQGLNNPTSLAFNSVGDLFVGTLNNNILEYAPGGGTPTTFASGLNDPYALAFNSTGDLFVANAAGDVGGAGFITEYIPGQSPTTVATGLSTPNGLAFNSAGDLFISEGPSVDAILEMAPGGTPTTYETGLNNPIGLAFNNAGDLFVADTGTDSENGDITEFSSTGAQLNVITSVSKPLSIAFQGEVLPVPEPSTLGLLVAGMAALLARRQLKFPMKR